MINIWKQKVPIMFKPHFRIELCEKYVELEWIYPEQAKLSVHKCEKWKV